MSEPATICELGRRLGKRCYRNAKGPQQLFDLRRTHGLSDLDLLPVTALDAGAASAADTRRLGFPGVRLDAAQIEASTVASGTQLANFPGALGSQPGPVGHRSSVTSRNNLD